MKIEIRVGHTTNGKRIHYYSEKLDDVKKEKQRMYKFLSEADNCIIENVDEFLLYTLNNRIMSYNVEEVTSIPKFNPEKYRIFENDMCIQDNKGLIQHNYFNSLMDSVMDDFYEGLSHY